MDGEESDLTDIENSDSIIERHGVNGITKLSV
jgi:hypothetical protein